MTLDDISKLIENVISSHTKTKFSLPLYKTFCN